MRISHPDLQVMYNFVNVDYHTLILTLLNLGEYGLKEHLQDMWSPDNPTWGYCYAVSEFVYWYRVPLDREDYQPRILINPKYPQAKHWFLKHKLTGRIIDLTANQFDNYEDIDYNKSKGKFFIPIKGGGPSLTAKKIAIGFGHPMDDWIHLRSTLETHLENKFANGT